MIFPVKLLKCSKPFTAREILPGICVQFFLLQWKYSVLWHA